METNNIKKFSIEDIIKYNNPCVSCHKITNFRFQLIDKKSNYETFLNQEFNSDYLILRPRIKYNIKNSLELIIYHKLNKIFTNHWGLLTEFLREYTLYLISWCKECYSEIRSEKLIFDLDKQIIYASCIKERIYFRVGNITYRLITDHKLFRTHLDIYGDGFTNLSSVNIPALYLYNYKEKDALMNKIKKYIIFL